MRRVEVIGNATLYLGDCREVLPALEPVDAVVTDPPYGMDFRSNMRSIKHDRIANDHDIELLLWACRLQPSHSLYVFCRWDNLRDVPPPKSCITWVKPAGGMGDLEHEHGRSTEIALFYPGSAHKWPDKRPSDVIYAGRTGNEYHPTEKPVGLIEQMLRWTCGVVTDPFMGSGTTGVACAKLGRRFIGIELDERYFDIACERIARAEAQPDLFVKPAEPEQADAFGGAQ